MKKFLITGASGFVGSNLTQFCKENGIQTSTLSLRKELPDSLPVDIDAVIHLAGKAHDLSKTSEPEEYFKVNTDLTEKLFDLFILSDIPVFIFLSSVKASADSVDFFLTEEQVPNPFTAYGKSKLKAENYLLSKQLPVGKKLFILRPCMIHGPGNKGNLNLLYQLVKMRVPYPLAAFENKRSFLSVSNLCFVIKELAERGDIPSGVYNIADNVPLSTKEVMQIMADVLCTRPLFLKLNKSLVKGMASLGDKIPFGLNTERLKKLTENYVVNTDKLLSVLRKPLPQDSKEGLRVSIKSFLDGK